MTEVELTLHNVFSTHTHTYQPYGGKRTVIGRDHHCTVFTSKRQYAFGHSCSICDHQGRGTVFKCRCLCTWQVTGHDKVSRLKSCTQGLRLHRGNQNTLAQFALSLQQDTALEDTYHILTLQGSEVING